MRSINIKKMPAHGTKHMPSCLSSSLFLSLPPSLLSNTKHYSKDLTLLPQDNHSCFMRPTHSPYLPIFLVPDMY